MHALFSLGGVHFIDLAQNFFSIALFQDSFVGDYLLGYFDFVFRKKLLRFSRTGSALAVIMPVYFSHGGLLFELVV